MIDHLKHHLHHPHPLNPKSTESAFEKALSTALGLISYAENVAHLKTIDDIDTHSWMVVVEYKYAYYANIHKEGRRLYISPSFDCSDKTRWWSRLHRLLWSFMLRARDPEPEISGDEENELFNLIRGAARHHMVITYGKLNPNPQLRGKIHWLNCQLTIPTITLEMNSPSET